MACSGGPRSLPSTGSETPWLPRFGIHRVHDSSLWSHSSPPFRNLPNLTYLADLWDPSSASRVFLESGRYARRIHWGSHCTMCLALRIEYFQRGQRLSREKAGRSADLEGPQPTLLGTGPTRASTTGSWPSARRHPALETELAVAAIRPGSRFPRRDVLTQEPRLRVETRRKTTAGRERRRRHDVICRNERA